MGPLRTRTVPTPVGDARLHEQGQGPRVLVLSHGAGGGIDALDLRAATAGARALGWRVVRVEMPWRVAGRRVAEAPARLDLAWRAALEALDGELLVVGGRSAGARVACRTARSVSAAAVLALAFPLVPPRGASRLSELQLPDVPRLVVQGERDAFGVPVAEPGLQVHVVAGADHAFAVRRRDGRDAAGVARQISDVVGRWLGQTLT